MGLTATHPDAKDPKKWKGENLLGKILDLVKQNINSTENVESKLNLNSSNK